jgi:hypothetical protein
VFFLESKRSRFTTGKIMYKMCLIINSYIYFYELETLNTVCGINKVATVAADSSYMATLGKKVKRDIK